MKHPRIERRAYHGVTRDQQAELLIRQLAIPGNKGTAVVMTGEQWA
jgi:hypothetical protein